jgi:hypothetical protein
MSRFQMNKVRRIKSERIQDNGSAACEQSCTEPIASRTEECRP